LAGLLAVFAAMPTAGEASLFKWKHKAVVVAPGVYGYGYYYPASYYSAYRQPYYYYPYYYPAAYYPAYTTAYAPAATCCDPCRTPAQSCCPDPCASSCVDSCDSCDATGWSRSSKQPTEVTPGFPQPAEEFDDGTRTPETQYEPPTFLDDTVPRATAPGETGPTVNGPNEDLPATKSTDDPSESLPTVEPETEPDASNRRVHPDGGQPRISVLGLDDSVTSPAAPKHSRLIVRSNYVRPRVARQRVMLNPDWVVVADAPLVARRAD
jgi:hypothetical protein